MARLLAVLVVVIALATPAWAGFWANGSFEDTSSGTGWTSSIPGWTLTPAGSVASQRSGVFSSFGSYSPTDGNYFAVLTNNGGGAQILQSSSFTIGSSSINVDYAFITQNTPPDNVNKDPFTVSLVTSGGSTITVTDATDTGLTSMTINVGPFTGTSYGTQWRTFTADVSAFIGQTAFLQAKIDDSVANVGGTSGILLDRVVPEPSTLILFGAGLLGLGFYARRRMRRK
jgi:hypothetical protein